MIQPTDHRGPERDHPDRDGQCSNAPGQQPQSAEAALAALEGETEEDLGNILISGSSSNAQIYLRDVATIERGYRQPANSFLRFDGHSAIGIGISTVTGGNVVAMGEALKTPPAPTRSR